MNIRLLDLFDCLPFSQYMPMSPHDIGCKETLPSMESVICVGLTYAVSPPGV